jgi:hypothetical protein
MMRHSALSFFLLSVFIANASAQTTRAPESVTVTGTRAREVLDGFVQSFAVPARKTGQLPRWEDGICPTAVGLRPAATKFITGRLKDVAVQVGARVNERESCKPNIAIIFTTAPQALMDNVRKKQPWFLGYADNSDQLEKLATVTRPIQAWYLTATKDLTNNVQVDTSTTVGPGLELTVPCPPPGPGMCNYFFPNAYAASTSATRLGGGLHSIFYTVVIVVDPSKLVEYEIGSLADYISLLALTQIGSLDTCQQLPSIVNMLAPACANKADALTENDLGYLRGIYKMSVTMTLRSQKDEIAYQMEQKLEGR